MSLLGCYVLLNVLSAMVFDFRGELSLTRHVVAHLYFPILFQGQLREVLLALMFTVETVLLRSSPFGFLF